MHGPFQAIKISDNVYWVGAIDWTLREFHGYQTQRGSTYNAYLILADKITLIDTVKAPFLDEMKSRIASIIEPGKIDYIISNHAEMDHSGGLGQTIQWAKPEKVFSSKMGKKVLNAQMSFPADAITTVNEGESLSLGNMNLHFIETRMLHWPDSMFSYLAEEELLFSQDGFGMHLATESRFTDLVNPAIVNYETAKYYANIIMLYSPIVLKTLEKVNKLNLPIKMIAPDHGPIWRTPNEIQKILNLYMRWGSQQKSNKAVVVFDTMWGSTTTMAKVIAEGLTEDGVKDVSLMSMSASHRSDVATELLEAAALVVGSPTMNNQLYPTIADVLCYLKGLKPQNLIGGAFGSYGWSGEAPGYIAEQMQAMKVEMIGEPIKSYFKPTDEILGECELLGEKIAERIKKNPIF